MLNFNKIASCLASSSTTIRIQATRKMSSGFKIYTKTGDAGTTMLFTGDRLNKDHAIFQSLGSIDELNAHLGLARHHYLEMVAQKPAAGPGVAHDLQLEEI